MDAVTHPLAPIYQKSSHTLLLGTMPSPVSRARGFYYAHPQNRFWPVLSGVFGVPVPQDDAARTRLILEHDLALWDVLFSCEITGASDASIRDPVPNDVAMLLAATSVTRIFTTGAAAGALYRRYVEPTTHLPCTVLPSPSAANARMSRDALVDVYRSALLQPNEHGASASCR